MFMDEWPDGLTSLQVAKFMGITKSSALTHLRRLRRLGYVVSVGSSIVSRWATTQHRHTAQLWVDRALTGKDSPSPNSITGAVVIRHNALTAPPLRPTGPTSIFHIWAPHDHPTPAEDDPGTGTPAE
jgi:hypothetical protein